MVLVTAHLVPEPQAASPETPLSAEAVDPVPPTGIVSPEQHMVLRQDCVNSDPTVRDLLKSIAEIERDLVVLRQKFTSTYPTVVQKTELLEAFRKKLDQRRTELQEEFDRGLAERLQTAPARSSKEATVTETRRIRLKHMQPSRAKQFLSPAFAPYVQVEPSRTQDPNNDSNALLVTAAPSLINRIVEDIRQIDRVRRQVLLDAYVVVMERGDLLNLGVEWSWPKVQAGVSTSPAPDAATGTTSGWPYGVQIGSTPDRTFTGSLMMALNLLQENGKADIIATPKLVALDGRQAEMRVIQEEWFMMLSPQNNSSSYSTPHLSKIESGTVLAITPYIGDNNDITLIMAVEVSDSMPKARGSGLPLVTRRLAKNSVTVKDGGTVAVAGLTKNGAKQEDKAQREVAVFVTVHLIPEPRGALRMPPSDAPTRQTPAAGIESVQVSALSDDS